jgi:hypothetical protein
MFSVLHAEKREGLVDFADVMDVVWDDAQWNVYYCTIARAFGTVSPPASALY